MILHLHSHFSHLADALIQSDVHFHIFFRSGPQCETNPLPWLCERHALPTEPHRTISTYLMKRGLTSFKTKGKN